MNTAVRYFSYVLGAAILASLVGGLFAALVATISPEFVKGLFMPEEGASLTRYAAAVGAIWGGIHWNRCDGILPWAGDPRADRQILHQTET